MKYNISEWSTDDLMALLEYSGYGSDGIISCKYKNMSTGGDAIFTVDYEDVDGDIDSGNVYVGIRNGKLVAEW